MIRNCVQTRILCTRQQFLYHFSLLSVLKMRVVAGDSQTGMPNLIFHEVAGHHVRLHVAHSTVSEGVHPTGLMPSFLQIGVRTRLQISRFSSGVPSLA